MFRCASRFRTFSLRRICLLQFIFWLSKGRCIAVTVGLYLKFFYWIILENMFSSIRFCCSWQYLLKNDFLFSSFPSQVIPVISCSQGIDKIAWDGTGERLALSYNAGDELYKGLIAIYDVRRNPLISASLMWVLYFKWCAFFVFLS